MELCALLLPQQRHGVKKCSLLLQEILLTKCRMQFSLKPEMKLLTSGPGQHPL